MEEDFEIGLAKMLALNPRDVGLELRFTHPSSACAAVRGDDGYVTVMEIDPEHLGLYKEALERRFIEVWDSMMML